ncbi:unnamed protein product [Victoria cruziana]
MRSLLGLECPAFIGTFTELLVLGLQRPLPSTSPQLAAPTELRSAGIH